MRIHVAHLAAGVVILISSVCVAKDTADQPLKAAIERVLRTQQNAWNHHDLEGLHGGVLEFARSDLFFGRA
jgi:hypothetical protein